MVSFTMVRRHDGLAGDYARSMDHFDCGTALFQPVAGGSMTPPCVGYHDSKGDWNPVADIAWRVGDGKVRNAKSGRDQEDEGEDGEDGFEPMERPPVKMERLDMEWRPRTSKGVRQWSVDAKGETLPNIPVGATAQIKYQSKSKFGAVLMCKNPITQTAYNDETLLRSWVTRNSRQLSERHGPEIRRYGLILVTTTYTASRASINAWRDKDKEALMNAKVKAQMLGDDGITLDYNDQLTDKDWATYAQGPKKDGVVVFFDGFEYAPWEWWWQGLKLGLGSGGPVKTPSREKEGNALLLRQTTMSAQRPVRTTGLSQRESLVGQRKRSWDEKKPVQQNGSLEVQSLPRSRRASPVHAQSPLGVRRTDPPPTDGWRHSMPVPVSAPPKQEDVVHEDQQPLLATAAPNGTTDNRLSFASTATTNSDPRSGGTQATESTATAYTDPDFRNSKPSARMDTADADYKDRYFNDVEHATTAKEWNSRSREPEHSMPRMPFEETKASRPPATDDAGYEEQHLDDTEPKYMNSRVRQLNGHELDYGKTRNRDSGASQLESSSITPRHSLRHKTSSPSLRKSS